MAREVSPTCLGMVTNANCLLWNGGDFPELDIKNGDSIEWVVQKLRAKFLTIPTAEQTLNLNLHCLGGPATNSCIAQIANRVASASLVPSPTGQKFSWDMSGIVDQLPEGISLSSASAEIRANPIPGAPQSAGGSGSATKGAVDIIVSSLEQTGWFDAILTLRLNSDCGLIVLRKEFLLSVGVPKQVVLESSGQGELNQQSMSLAQALGLFATEICVLRDKIAVMEQNG